jgi:hypothetical protein
MMSRSAHPYRVGLVVGMLAVMFAVTGSASGHCDTMDGPVVIDAQAALEAGDPTGVLKWVPRANEDEIRQVFQKTLVVRAKGPEAKELADMYFFETLVRLHRASEGAPYTGIKPAGTPMPAPVAKSDEALEKDNVDDLARRIAAAVETGIRKRFAAAADARRHKDESVEAGRRFVAAYVQFVHYVEAVHDIATGHSAPHGHAAAATEEHQPQEKPATAASKHEH